MNFDRPHGRLIADELRARWLAAAFVFYGLIAIGFLAINVPPFQAPDEPNHFLRAVQIADGGLVGKRFSIAQPNGSLQVTAGGLSDPAIARAAAPFAQIPFHPDVKATRADWAPNIHWSRTRSLSSFPNTVIYPPFFYLPSALGVIIGRAADLSILRTLIVSRLLSGVAAVAIGALAIAIAGGAAAWIFAILTLPMSLFLMASVSQDGLMIACSSLAGALLVRLLRRPSAHDRRSLVWLVVMLGLVGMARPPYGLLALLPPGLGKVQLRWRILASMSIAAAVATWSAIVAVATFTNFGTSAVRAEPMVQLALLLKEPLSVFAVISSALKPWHSYFVTFIGVLGWLDTVLPIAYYKAAAIVLALAAAATVLGIRRDSVGRSFILPTISGLLLSTAAIFGMLYFAWTPPGEATVAGIQGRYFLPIALAGTALFPVLGNARLARLQNWLFAVIVSFPALTLVVVMRAVILRYYLQ